MARRTNKGRVARRNVVGATAVAATAATTVAATGSTAALTTFMTGLAMQLGRAIVTAMGVKAWRNFKSMPPEKRYEWLHYYGPKLTLFTSAGLTGLVRVFPRGKKAQDKVRHKVYWEIATLMEDPAFVQAAEAAASEAGTLAAKNPRRKRPRSHPPGWKSVRGKLIQRGLKGHRMTSSPDGTLRFTLSPTASEAYADHLDVALGRGDQRRWPNGSPKGMVRTDFRSWDAADHGALILSITGLDHKIFDRLAAHMQGRYKGIPSLEDEFDDWYDRLEAFGDTSGDLVRHGVLIPPSVREYNSKLVLSGRRNPRKTRKNPQPDGVGLVVKGGPSFFFPEDEDEEEGHWYAWCDASSEADSKATELMKQGVDRSRISFYSILGGEKKSMSFSQVVSNAYELSEMMERKYMMFDNPKKYRTKRASKKAKFRFVVHSADHGISSAQMKHIQSQLEDVAPQGFFIETVQVPHHLGPVPNALYGPDSGDKAVPERAVHYMNRSGRGWDDRMVDLPPRPADFVQAIGTRKGNTFSLYTVHGGPLAPMHPEDPDNQDPKGSAAWWKKHALSSHQWDE